jgi:hypothetical protein
MLLFIDESGLGQRPHRCHTWASREQTLILQYNFDWKGLSLAARLTVWKFYFRGVMRVSGKRASAGFSEGLGAPPVRAALLVVWGPPAGASQPARAELRCQSAGLNRPGLSATLRA